MYIHSLFFTFDLWEHFRVNLVFPFQDGGIYLFFLYFLNELVLFCIVYIQRDKWK